MSRRNQLSHSFIAIMGGIALVGALFNSPLWAESEDCCSILPSFSCPEVPPRPCCPCSLADRKAAGCYGMCSDMLKDCMSRCDALSSNIAGTCIQACDTYFTSCKVTCFSSYKPCYTVYEETCSPALGSGL